MDKKHLKGAAEKASGAAKDAFGKATGSDKRRVEGAIDKAKGTAHEVLGDAKDVMKKPTSMRNVFEKPTANPDATLTNA